MKITVISDLHGEFPRTNGGDLLLLCGDYTGSNKPIQWVNFFNWIHEQNYRKTIFIGGNHDLFLSQCLSAEEQKVLGIPISNENIEYLCDTGTEFEGVKIWGAPWSLSFKECNPDCRHFMKGEEKLQSHWCFISPDTEILMTHSPPYGILDRNRYGMPCGSIGLLDRINQIKPVMSVFGHIHEGYGHYHHGETHFINASLLDADYIAVNKPVNLILEGTPGCRKVEILKD
jgi:Icc-related predicted phosphoesterase